MVISIVTRLLTQFNRKWKIGEDYRVPTENEVKKVLDSAAQALYSKRVGATFDMGGLHIEKTTHAYDVYVHVGEYK